MTINDPLRNKLRGLTRRPNNRPAVIQHATLGRAMAACLPPHKRLFTPHETP